MSNDTKSQQEMGRFIVEKPLEGKHTFKASSYRTLIYSIMHIKVVFALQYCKQEITKMDGQLF